MKLLTQKETDRIFYKYANVNIHDVDDIMLTMDSNKFNDSVNAMLMDPKIVKKLLKRVQRIKSKL